MRDLLHWDTQVKDACIKKSFTPRIQKDLLLYPPAKKMPDIGQGLYLFGPTESGKTILSAHLLLEEQKQIYLEGGPASNEDVCVMVSMGELLYQIKATFQQGGGNEVELIDYYSKVRLLVLDDFGTIKPTDWVIATLYTIINYRYEWLKKTIINSNLSLSEMARVMGDDRITSRIERMCRIIQKTKSWE